MNSRNLIAALSCLGAGLLAAILVVAKSRPPVAAGDLPDRLEPSTSVKPRTPPRASAPRATVPPTAFRWASLESTNYFEYVANLRSIGCPEDTIRDIIVADINKFYAPREAPFKADPLALGPADGLNAAARRANRLADFERRRQLRGIQKEKNALLKQLLNIQLPLEPVGSISARDYERFESAFSALPPEKRDTVREIQEEYWLSLDALRERSLARRGPEYLEALKQVSAQRKAQLAKVLTPGELEEFEMRSSNTGSALTEALADFHPTEEEFRQIFRIRQRLDDPEPAPGGSDAAANRASYAEREKAAEEQIKAVLGEARYAEYQRAQDETYQDLARLAERYGLPPESAAKGYDAVMAFDDEEEKLRADRSLNVPQRREALKALRGRRDKALQDTIGPKATKAFKRQYSLDELDEDEP